MQIINNQKKHKRTLLLILIIAQTTLISFLTKNILSQSNILGKTISHLSSRKIPRQPGDPLKHFQEPKPNTNLPALDLWLEQKVTYTINSNTLNERLNYSEEKPENTYRIITLGDSFTFGQNVPTKKNYPETLESSLNQTCQETNFQVINLGVGGYDIEHAVNRFRIRGKKYHPDLVIWFIKDDDLNKIREITAPLGEKLWQEYRDNPTLTNHKKAAQQTSKNFSETYNYDQALEYNKKALTLINNHYQDKLLLITFSFTKNQYQTILKDFTESRPNTFYFNQLTNIFTKNQTLPDGHPNQEGYAQIAQDISHHLIENQLIPCKPG